ncbi:MAG: hypothetical protein ACOX22_08095 [Caldicoprobacterales bacterium]
MKQAVSERCGISKDAVFIACTHTHTACHLDGSDRMDSEFARYFSRKLCDCVQIAQDDLKTGYHVHIQRRSPKHILCTPVCHEERKH